MLMTQVLPCAHGPGIPRSLPMLMTLVFLGPSLCSWPWYSQVPPYMLMAWYSLVPPYAHGPGPSLCSWPWYSQVPPCAHGPGIPRSLPMLMAWYSQVPPYAHDPGIPRSLPMLMALVFPGPSLYAYGLVFLGPSLCSWPWSLPMLMALVFPGPSLCSWPWYSQVPPYAHGLGIPRSLPMLMALVFPYPSLCSWPWYSQVPPCAHGPGIPRSLPMLMVLVFPGEGPGNTRAMSIGNTLSHRSMHKPSSHQLHVCIGYSTTTRAVWFILLEHEGRRPEGESNINHTARKVVV